MPMARRQPVSSTHHQSPHMQYQRRQSNPQGRPSPPIELWSMLPPQFCQEKLHISVSRQIAIKPQEGNQLGL